MRTLLITLLAVLLAAVPVLAADFVLPGGLLLKIITQTLNPTANAALGGNLTSTAFEQTFTVTGLTTADYVFVNGPSPTTLCPLIGARVSAVNTLALSFTKQTGAVCTPASGTYRITVVR